jgi:uncharacterized protein (DUF1330 family)
MSAYIIARIDITDRARYHEYTLHSPRCAAAFGGRMIVRNGERMVLEGEDDPRRIVVIEFPSMEDLRRFYDSPEYQKLRSLREGAGEFDFIAIDGLDPRAWDAAVAASSKLSL